MRNISQMLPKAEKVLEDSRRKEAFDLENDRSARILQVSQEGRAFQAEGTECSRHGLRRVHGIFIVLEGPSPIPRGWVQQQGWIWCIQIATSYLRKKNTKL